MQARGEVIVRLRPDQLLVLTVFHLIVQLSVTRLHSLNEMGDRNCTVVTDIFFSTHIRAPAHCATNIPLICKCVRRVTKGNIHIDTNFEASNHSLIYNRDAFDISSLF